MRVARLISLVLLLQSRETMTATELARELEVSERTIYRDVAALSAAGIPVYADMGRTGGYRLVGGYRTRLTGLNRAEAEALFLSGLRGPAGDLGLAEAVTTAQLKVLAALPPALRDVSAQAGQRFHLDAPGWFRDGAPPPLLTELARATWQDECVGIRYRRFRSERDLLRTVAPYGLVLKGGGDWYLVAQVDQQFRTYRVDRMQEVRPTGDTFTRDPEFDLAAFWTASAARFLESMFVAEVGIRIRTESLHRLHSIIERPAVTQAIANAEPDGPDWMRTRLPVESPQVAYGQLLRLGPEVEVLDPPEVRERLATTGRRLAELYS
ncbi:MAG TPA: YafY family protein [Mycobacteriales bacterium]|nr:YafY family protein [Mycobacteriales bacterium]